MKSIYKNNKIKIFIWGLTLACVVSLGIFIQGCSQEDDYMNNIINNNDIEYLDLDVASTTAFTQTELNIIANAGKRITEHIIFDKDNNKYVYQLKSPSEINVSERLFNYIYSSLHIEVSSVPRLKSDLESTLTTGLGYYQVSSNLTDQETIELMQGIINYLSFPGVLISASGLIQAFKGTPYVGFVTALAGILLSVEWLNVDFNVQ